MVEEFHYRIGWRAGGHRPGHHLSRQPGGGFAFRGYAPLLAAPDPRRLDLHASLRDPFEQWVVRLYHQKSSIPVYLVADLSASMGFAGTARKLDLLADFCASLGYSAYRTGDPFGFIGCDTAVRGDFLLAPSHAKGAAMEMSLRLRAFAPTGTAATGLAAAADYLGRQRCLVFVASDFHFPGALLEALLASLARHDVVPVVLWDSAEFERLPRFGIGLVRDSESGRRRPVLMRTALRSRIAAAYAERRRHLERAFAPYGRKPLFMIDRFSAEAMTGYFYPGESHAG
jgi:uncharacterized protein (DUF58 family)